MMTTQTLLLDVLIKLVESVADQPRRVLFKGVSDLSAAFQAQAQPKGWMVKVTRENEDVVGARNDSSIATLVVFYRHEVRERESLNAFRQFDEAAIAEALVRFTAAGALPDHYKADEIERLRSLLKLVYPSAEQLAEFLLAGKAKVGSALPHLGLFADPDLNYDMKLRQWSARISDNHQMAVLRWRDFLDKGQRNQDAKRLLRPDRLKLLAQAETDPSIKTQILTQVTYRDALQVLNPPTRLISELAQAGMTREQAETLKADVQHGRVNPRQLPSTFPPLPESLIKDLEKIARHPREEGDDEGQNSDKVPRVGFCLEGLLNFAGQQAPFPRHFYLTRKESHDHQAAELQLVNGRWQAQLTPEAARALSVPGSGATELNFRIFVREGGREKDLFFFTLENLAGRLESFAEIWPDDDFWTKASALDPTHHHLWQQLKQQVSTIRNIVDPDWKKEQVAGDVEPEREPNNPIYLIFDLVYLAHRDLFEGFFDIWLTAATLPWRASVAANPSAWQNAMAGLLQLGLANRSDEAMAVLPFYPLRLAWYRQIFTQIETWLSDATTAPQPLLFEPAVLSEQFQAVDRPHVLYHKGERLVEASTAPFFSLFVPESRQQRVRAPLDRAKQKLDQFGRMWPFSLARLHLAFQPGDAGDDVYRLLAVQAETDPDAAFRVRAVVDGPGVMTSFDRYLLTTGDETTDLLTQEHHESMLPRVDYTKGRLDETGSSKTEVAAHVALLIDAFREEESGFKLVIGRLNNNPHWNNFRELVALKTPQALAQLKAVDLSAPPYHSGPVHDGRRDLVYVPLSNEQPEYLRLLFDSLSDWVTHGDFSEGAYYERVRWDAEALAHLHHCADWVILFDRTLDKSLFTEKLAPTGVRLIDFYTNLRGGYRLSISSRRTDAVEWQLAQVLSQTFARSGLDLRQVAHEMLNDLAKFASGLLLKTLGGGSLAQELLGLYATYRSLIAEGEFTPGRDWLIPLDNYQHWFGRRTQRGRRADLLVLRSTAPNQLEMLAVESKWYKQTVGKGFVADEFGPDGQLRTAIVSLLSLFDPQQARLDRDYWQRTLYTLLDEAPDTLKQFRQAVKAGDWTLLIDGIVYVHQYTASNAEAIAQLARDLNQTVSQYITPADAAALSRDANFNRLRLKSYPELIKLYAPTGN